MRESAYHECVRVLLLILEMALIVAGLLLAVGVIFYVVCWATLAAVSFFPLVGRRHRHGRWEELNRDGGRRTGRD